MNTNQPLAHGAFAELTNRLFAPERLRRVALLWLPVSVVMLLCYLRNESAVGLTDGVDHPFGSDFISFWSAAHLAAIGKPATAYDSLAMHDFQVNVTRAPFFLYYYIYPPLAILLSLPLGFLPYLAGYVVWSLGSILSYATAMWRSFRSVHVTLLALAAPGVFINAWNGQTGAWTAALLGGGLGLLSRRAGIGGALLGLLAFKPHFLLLVPFALLAGREWRAFAAFAGTAALLTLATFAVWGPELWIAWLKHVAALSPSILEDAGDNYYWYGMPTIFVTLLHLHLSVHASYVGQALVSLATCLFVCRTWLSDIPREAKNAVLILGVLIASPYIHDYDLLAASFVPPWLISYSRDDAWRRKVLWASTPLIIAPAFSSALNKMFGLPVGWALLAPAVALVAHGLWQRLPARGRIASDPFCPQVTQSDYR